MISTDDIMAEDLTDGEFRVYTYYRSQSPNHKISASKTAAALHRSQRSIQETNKSLIQKGYLLIKGQTNPTYFIGIDAVEQGYSENKKYFDEKKRKNQIRANKQKKITKLTSENRLTGSQKKKKTY